MLETVLWNIPTPTGEECCGGSILRLSTQKYSNDLSDIAENKGLIKVDRFLALVEERWKEIGLLA